MAARLDRLGAAREVAQIGAVLGRSFLYELLRDVASPVGHGGSGFSETVSSRIEEASLQSALDRLLDADLLYVEGVPPTASYRFKHALIQDAAYDSLLKSNRQALHRRAGEALIREAAEPEAVAHHFTEAGLDDLAIEWWSKAGDKALRRAAFKEAIAHLGKAIAMADKEKIRILRGDESYSSRLLKLHTDYGHAVMWFKGFAADETKVAYERVAELASQTDDSLEKKRGQPRAMDSKLHSRGPRIGARASRIISPQLESFRQCDGEGRRTSICGFELSLPRRTCARSAPPRAGFDRIRPKEGCRRPALVWHRHRRHREGLFVAIGVADGGAGPCPTTYQCGDT